MTMLRSALVLSMSLLACACASPGPSSSRGRTSAHRPAREPVITDVLIPPEKIDELEQYFNARNSAISRCFEGKEASETKKARSVRVTVSLKVAADGTPRDVKISDATTADEALKSCVIEMVASWSLPAPGADMVFSHGYAFEGE